MNPIHLQIPSHADYIDIVRLCLYGVACRIGFSYEEIEDMKVAVAEACNNAVLHGHSADDLGVIDISFIIEDASLSIKIKDNGSGFNYTDALHKASPLGGVEVSELHVGGLGIFLMQALMDEVTVNSEHGTEVMMTKYRTTKNPLDS
jgi:serine/threonine-protein kinase RsbW